MKNILKIIFVIFLSFALFSCAALPFQKNKARNIAQNYLSQKYTQEMKPLNTRFSFIDPALYHVYFSPVNNDKIVFEVIVQLNFSLDEWINEDGRNFVPDNYYIAYFEYLLKDFFFNDAAEIWGDKINFVARGLVNGMYAFEIPRELNDKLPLTEMAELIDEYLLIIDTNKLINNNNKTNEAEKIFEFVKIVQRSVYRPSRIVFWYNVPKSNQNKEGRSNVSFSDWNELVFVDQIELRINEEFFSSVSKADDAYYKQYFQEELGKKFMEDAAVIWGENINITAEMERRDKSISEYKIYGLTKDVNIDDIEYKLHDAYSLRFYLPIHYDNDNTVQQAEEAEKIFRLLKIIQESGYGPHIISFIYYYPDSSKQQNFGFFRNWGTIRWQKVDSVESVIEGLNDRRR